MSYVSEADLSEPSVLRQCILAQGNAMSVSGTESAFGIRVHRCEAVKILFFVFSHRYGELRARACLPEKPTT